MRRLMLLVFCLPMGLVGCGGSKQKAHQPPPGVEADTSELEIDVGDIESSASIGELQKGGGAKRESPGRSSKSADK